MGPLHLGSACAIWKRAPNIARITTISLCSLLACLLGSGWEGESSRGRRQRGGVLQEETGVKLGPLWGVREAGVGWWRAHSERIRLPRSAGVSRWGLPTTITVPPYGLLHCLDVMCPFQVARMSLSLSLSFFSFFFFFTNTDQTLSIKGKAQGDYAFVLPPFWDNAKELGSLSNTPLIPVVLFYFFLFCLCILISRKWNACCL